MAYIKQSWENAPAKTTPLSAVRLGYMESGIASASASADTAVAALPGKADLVGGKLDPAQVPDLSVSDFLGVAADQTAMLALSGQRGDWCARTDTGSTWILVADNATQLSSWRELSYPASPVSSVAGKTGAVTLVKADVGLGNVDNTADAAKPVSTATATALALKANASSVPIKLTDLDTTVTGAQLNADHAKLAGVPSGTTPVGSGASNLVIGPGASTVGSNSTAVGVSAAVGSSNATAFGATAQAQAYLSTTVGYGAVASGSAGVAIGGQANAAQQATAVGVLTSASAQNAIAIGYTAQAGGGSGVAVGASAKAGVSGVALGSGADSSANTGSIAIGQLATNRNNQTRLGNGVSREVHLGGKVVLQSPNGSEWLLNVSNTGVLTATAYTP